MSKSYRVRKSDSAMREAFRSAGFDLPNEPLQLPSVVSISTQRPAIPSKTANQTELDLHGFGEDQAYEKLEAFIRECHRARCGQVLVITGKGSGKLKRLVPLWLAARPFKELVADVRIANPWDGGEGALYVRLHEKRVRIS